MTDNKKSKKFDYLKALGDYNLTNAEKATLIAMWNHADANTGYLWANLTHINEWCSRSPRSGGTTKHIQKAEKLGLLTIGGSGRSRNYTLNLNIESLPKIASSQSSSQDRNSQVRNDGEQDRNDCEPSSQPMQTNRSSNRPSNTSTSGKPIRAIPNKEKMDALKIKLLEECGVEVPPDYPNNSIYSLLDSKDARSEHSDRELTPWELRQEAINAEFRGAE